MRDMTAAVLTVALSILSGCAATSQSPLPAGEAGYIAVESPVSSTPGGPYTLRAGDVVSVRVFGEQDLSSDEVTLDARGNILLPLVGELPAAGLSAAELGDIIERAYGERYLRNPTVTVAVREAQSQMVTVEGEVEQPGSFPYSSGQTLLTALAQARSPTNVAALSDVAVFRTIDGQRYGGRFDIRAIRRGEMRDLALQPGDLIVVGYSERRAGLQTLLRNLPLVGALAPL